MLALLLLVLLVAIMWSTQTILLWATGRPLRLRISLAGLPRPLKLLSRTINGCALAAILLTFPILRGVSPVDYYGGLFPGLTRPREMLHGAAAATLYLALVYLAWTVTDNVRFQIRHSWGRLIRRLAGVPPTALLIATFEELLFRGMLLSDLLRSFTPAIAVGVGAAAFAAAHYLRPVKRYWTFPGHLALGVLLCLSFLWTRALWLPIGLHAGGVLVLMAVRPFIRYTGPAWLAGASIFPYAGLVGVLALGLLTLNMWLSFGGAA